ncbi:MAG: helix-turn-helix domain-containing protein [Bdellovibrionota bacterium]
MPRIHIPSIEGYTCYRKYLSDIILCKDIKDSPMSYRYLAKNINCSPSYLNDVVKGRTNLRLGKAMAIANFLRMDAATKAKWLLLLLKEIEDEDVFRYFEEQLQNASAFLRQYE